MFSTLKQKLLLGVYIFILLSIPVGAYLASQNQVFKSRASEQKPKKTYPQTSPKPLSSILPAKELLGLSQKGQKTNSSMNTGPTPTSSPSDPSPTIANSYGPTLSLKINIEGRPKDNQAVKLFVGIAEGNLTSNPKFLLSFSIDVPASGQYANLSLAGLTSGTRYTALLKGSAQIATSSAFTMTPTVTNINEGLPLNLISGDLNDDNVINSADYSIAQKAFGVTLQSVNWNENADLNTDGMINAFDLSIIYKNIGKVGASGAWTSPIPQVASPSASLNSPPIGGPTSDKGYWLWVPTGY